MNTFESERLEEISCDNISLQVAKWMESEIADHKDRVIAVALSGGLDSVCLLLILKSLDYKLKAVHCNFGLRGKESEADAFWCQQFCKDLGIPLIVKELDATMHAKKQATSIQESARILRYELFSELHTKREFDLMALGHHLDDSIESFFVNLIRGTGIKGLSGISARRDFFIRPFTQISKEQLITFSENYQICHREDSSNQKDVYLRNKIRLNLIPEIKKIQPSYKDILKRNMNQMRAEEEILDQFGTTWREKNVTFQDDRILISKSSLFDFPNPALLFQIIGKLGFNWKTCENLVSNIKSIPGKIYRSDHYEILIDRDHLMVRPITSLIFDEIVIESSEIGDQIALPSGKFVISPIKKEEINFSSHSNIEYVDASRLDWPLLIRKRQAGDKFQPMNMPGKHKKVKEYLIDEKVNLFDKETLLILTDQKSIIWLIGNRLDNKYRVSDESQTIIKLEYQPDLDEDVTD